MNINGINSQTRAMDSQNSANTGVKESPSASSVQSFNQAMGNEKSAQTENTASSQTSGGQSCNQSNMDSQLQELKDLLTQLAQMLTQMLQGGQTGGSPQEASKTGGSGDSKSHGGSTPNGENGGIKPVNGSGPGGSAGSSELIPAPQENIQTLNLGGKQVTVGGDGTGNASASEVKATADNIQNLYNNSPTFRNMIDSSSDQSFTVSVGRRDDNTSWGNTTGKVFMNLNNVSPNNSDTFQSLLGHEFAHASIDLGHGSQMEQVENAVAQEA